MSARRQRFAHCAESEKSETQKRTIFLSHASLPRNFLREFRRKIPAKGRAAASPFPTSRVEGPSQLESPTCTRQAAVDPTSCVSVT
jgi:hypothetical protein